MKAETSVASDPPIVINLTWVAPFAATEGLHDHWLGFRESEKVAVLTRVRSGLWSVSASPRGPSYSELHKIVDTTEAAEAFLRLHLDGVPVGTQVKWVVAARGGRLEKAGVVQQVVQPGQELTSEQRHETRARGCTRDLRSYLVRVLDADGVSGRLHWPRTVDLEVVKAAPQ